MVSGTTYGVQYEIYFKPTVDVDFFDDILPVWSSTRTRLSFEPVGYANDPEYYILVVIPVQDLDKRFNEHPEATQYIHEVNEHEYGTYRTTSTWEQIEAYDDTSMYYTACRYAITVQPRLQLSIPLRKCHLKTYNHPQIDEIRRIVESLTTISLTESEKRLVDMVIHHPSISGKIASHGMHLVSVAW